MSIADSLPKSKEEIERRKAFVERHPRTWWLIGGARSVGLVLVVIALGLLAGFAMLTAIMGGALFWEWLGVWAG